MAEFAFVQIQNGPHPSHFFWGVLAFLVSVISTPQPPPTVVASDPLVLSERACGDMGRLAIVLRGWGGTERVVSRNLHGCMPTAEETGREIGENCEAYPQEQVDNSRTGNRICFARARTYLNGLSSGQGTASLCLMMHDWVVLKANGEVVISI